MPSIQLSSKMKNAQFGDDDDLRSLTYIFPKARVTSNKMEEHIFRHHRFSYAYTSNSYQRILYFLLLRPVS